MNATVVTNVISILLLVTALVFQLLDFFTLGGF